MIVLILLLGAAFSSISQARISANTPAYLPDYADIDRLEAFGCAYPTFRALQPQGHADLSSAIIPPKESEEDDDKPRPDPCRAPEWVRRERAFFTRPLLLNEARLESVWVHNDLTPLLGTEATVTPLFPLRENRTTFNGPNLYTELSASAEAAYGDFGFAVGVTPGWVGGLDDSRSADGRFYLHEGYVKAGYRWTELTFGRTALRFGATSHGSLLLSASTSPIDLLKLTVRPHLLGSFLDVLGPVTFETFFTPPLQSNYVNGDRFWGMQLGLRPFSWLEIALMELYQFSGEGRPGLNLSDFMRMAVYSGASDLDAKRDRAFGLDLAVWLPSRRARLYTQAYFNSLTALSKWFSDDVSVLAGVWIPRLGKTEARLEYVHTVPSAYISRNYAQGLTYEGSPMGHPLGPDADGAYFDLGLPQIGDWRTMIGLLYESRGQHPSAIAPKPEARYGGTIGIKKRWTLVELSAQLAYHLIKNPLYQVGPDANALAGYVSLRYSFY